MVFIQHFRKSYQIYRYAANQDQEFALNEIKDQSGSYYMTAQGAPVQPGDYIEITQSQQCAKYQVDDVEYYCDPPDMWRAVLHGISN